MPIYARMLNDRKTVTKNKLMIAVNMIRLQGKEVDYVDDAQ